MARIDAGNDMSRRGYTMAQQDTRKAAENAVDKATEAAKDTAKDLREKAEDVVQQGAEAIDEARRRGAEALGAAKQGAADMAANVRDEAERLYHKGERKARQFSDQAVEEAEACYDELSQMVRRQPATALGIAAGVGFLLGLLIARR